MRNPRARGAAARQALAGRSSGLLLHPTSLPGPHGCGDLGHAAHRFVDALADAGQRWWQMLPVGPPGIGNSPYSALSAFAGSPLLISLATLADDGWLGRRDLAPDRTLAATRVDYAATARFRLTRLRRAFEAFRERASPAERDRLAAYRARERAWLDDYALFAALRARHAEASWLAWDPALRDRRPPAVAAARRRLAHELEFQRFLQWQFDRQWTTLRRYAAERGVGLIGDLPFYVAHDSADVWAHRQVFHLARDGTTLASAGVPPDAFSATGQLWGNPLYRWDTLRRSRFGWWVARVRRTLDRFDAVRLDHFIGFYRVWRVPAGAATAERGEWELSPGAELLRRLRAALGGLPFLAEDLGLVTPEVEQLRDAFGLPGTRVLQFGFDAESAADPHLPHNFPRHCVVCTGTHDHDTIVGWYRRGRGARGRRRRAAVLRYTGSDGRAVHWDLVRLALMSVGDTVIVPVQDVLGLGSEARMNLPGTSAGNWEWRLAPRALTSAIVARLGRMTASYGRGAPHDPHAGRAAAAQRGRARRSGGR